MWYPEVNDIRIFQISQQSWSILGSVCCLAITTFLYNIELSTIHIFSLICEILRLWLYFFFFNERFKCTHHVFFSFSSAYLFFSNQLQLKKVNFCQGTLEFKCRKRRDHFSNNANPYRADLQKEYVSHYLVFTRSAQSDSRGIFFTFVCF